MLDFANSYSSIGSDETPKDLLKMINTEDTLYTPYKDRLLQIAKRKLYAYILRDSAASVNDTLAAFIDSMAGSPEADFEDAYFLLEQAQERDSVFDIRTDLAKLTTKLSKLNSANASITSISTSDEALLRERRFAEIVLSGEIMRTQWDKYAMDRMYAGDNPDSLAHVLNDSLAYWSTFTQAQKDTLIAMAWSCPFEWGNVIIRARGAASSFDTSIFYMNLCEIYFEESARLSAHQKNKKEEEIRIFPNPSQGSFTIDLIGGIADMRLFSTTGQLLMNRKIISIETISLENIASGTYLIEVVSETGLMKHERLVILK